MDYLNGWDIYHVKCGANHTMYCRVCDEVMSLSASVTEASSYAEFLSGKSHIHDIFRCPNVNEKWHYQIRCLKLKLINEPSGYISKIIEDEIKDIYSKKQPTKDLSCF